MLANRLKQTDRLIHPVRYFFSRTFAIISGGPQHDQKTHKIIQGLKEAYDGDVNFIGVGSKENAADFKKLFASSSVLDATPFLVHRSYKQEVQDAAVTLYRTKTHYKNYRLIKELKKAGYFDELLSHKVSAIINVGNFSLTKRLNNLMIEHYKNHLSYSPPTFLYAPMNSLRQVSNEAFLDFQFSSIPRKSSSWTMYEFPHLMIGYDGLFKALKFLNQFGPIPAGAEGFGDRMFKLTSAARKQFRKKMGVSEDAFVILLGPGNNIQEVKFFIRQIRFAIDQFRKNTEIKSFGLDNFKIWILNNDKKMIAGNDKQYTVIDSQSRYAAMCAADYGIVHDGELAVEAAACQLGVTTLSSVSFMHAYLSNMLNLYESPLNVATDSLGYTELKSRSECNPYKIVNLMIEHFKRPQLKFFYIERYEKALTEMMENLVRDGKVTNSGLVQSYGVIKSYAQKYEALDLKSYSGHWQARKSAIVPEKNVA